jgi:regulator of sigma E protease
MSDPARAPVQPWLRRAWLLLRLAIVVGFAAIAQANGVAVWQTVFTIALFVFVLGVLVLVHELGHFVAARLRNVRVLEFGIGFPPRARVLANRGETLYTLNWLPIGGFVKLAGEDGTDADDPRSFSAQGTPTKVFILVAGVAMNFALAVLLLIGIALAGDPTIGIRISTIQPGSPAERAGLVVGDVIEAVNGQHYSTPPFTDMTVLDALRAHPSETVTLAIRHADGSTADVQATIRSAADIAANKGALGITRGPGDIVVTAGGISHSPAEAISLGWSRTVDAAAVVAGGVTDLFRALLTNPTTPPPAGTAGPVGIAVQLGDVFFNLGPYFTLYVIAVLSANLAVVNILPLPPLDGGRLLVILIKRFAGPRVSLRAERLTYAVGFTFLFAFFIWLTAFDILRGTGAIP